MGIPAARAGRATLAENAADLAPVASAWQLTDVHGKPYREKLVTPLSLPVTTTFKEHR